MASKIRVYGQAQNRTALGIMHAYMKLNPDATIENLRKAFPDTLAPDKGVAEIFVDSDFDDKGEHYFTQTDELIDTADGRKVAVVKLWTKPSYDNLVKRAAEFDIDVAEFEHQQQVGKKGSYYLEYVNGYIPAGEVETVQEYEESKMKRGSLGWLWVLLAILAIFIIALLVGKCNSSKDIAVVTDKSDTIVVTNTVTTDAATANGNSAALTGNAAATGAEGAATAKATGNTGACTTASQAVVSQLEKYQKAFDATEYPVGEYALKPDAKAILDNVAKLMTDNPGMKITVNGYASREGNPQANQVLSDKRAATVVSYLVSKGVASDRLKAVGLGTSDPISAQLPPNRRIDFVVQ